jgi:tRNA dimethylallyltransferase
MVAVVGPTAVGKSQFVLRLARYFSLEIINADSRQVYRYMDIGTNKPSVAERALVPHHVIDVVDPDEHFSLAIYHQLARRALENIEKKGNIAFLVGGTGLYVWSLIEGWKIPQVPPDPELRDQLEQRARREGSYSLYRELQKIDPITASKINPANVRRIIRGLEIYQATKRPPSQLQGKEPPKFRVLIIGLTQERNELYKKIDQRVDKMIKEGLIDEVKGLLARGYSPSLPSMSGIGYREVVRFLQGETTLPKAIERIKYETHRLARHQYAWFRLSDTRIKWLDVGDISKAESDARKLIEDFLAS